MQKQHGTWWFRIGFLHYWPGNYITAHTKTVRGPLSRAGRGAIADSCSHGRYIAAMITTMWRSAI